MFLTKNLLIHTKPVAKDANQGYDADEKRTLKIADLSCPPMPTKILIIHIYFYHQLSYHLHTLQAAPRGGKDRRPPMGGVSDTKGPGGDVSMLFISWYLHIFMLPKGLIIYLY